jgi:hypothetical protein
MRQKDRDYGFKAALTGAECHAIGFHGLRHTFASHFMMSGGNILTLQKLLGHSSVAVTMKYAHLAPDFMRDEIGLRFERPAATVAEAGPAGPARVRKRLENLAANACTRYVARMSAAIPDLQLPRRPR